MLLGNQESLANAKVSARQPWYIGHKLTQLTKSPITCILHSHTVNNCILITPSGGTPSNINVIYTSLKSTFSVQQFRR